LHPFSFFVIEDAKKDANWPFGSSGWGISNVR